MEMALIAIVAFFASGLTFFSGFGLGTLLLPVFALFFPLSVAIALTAIVHFLNNLFKLALVGKRSDMLVVLKFGIPAICAAFFGAWLLESLGERDPLWLYSLWGKTYQVSLIKLVMALVIIVFTFFESLSYFKSLGFNKKYLPLGGLISGFFGGLSGHQGALRSAFLLQLQLSKESFIATGVVIACIVDVARLAMYSRHITLPLIYEQRLLLVSAVVAAFLGAYLGNQFLKKITVVNLQRSVSVFLVIFAMALGAGMV